MIIGFGIIGRNLARTSREAGMDYTVIELNPDLVLEARKQGEPVIFGDATTEGVLEHAGIPTARIAVVAINDPVATRRTVGLSRRIGPRISIIVRTRYVSEVEAALKEEGADEVIAEEFGTSFEIFTVMLNKYFVPQDRIETFVTDVLFNGYRMLRSRTPVQAGLQI